MNKISILIRKILNLSLGLVNNFLLIKYPKVFIICYHSISDDGWYFSVKLEEFKKQINFLVNNFNFIKLSDLDLYLRTGKKFEQPAVILTFDDGYTDVHDTRDFLKRLNIKPAIFLISDIQNVDRVQLGSDKAFLEKQQILNLVKDGWEVGCHSATHTNLLKLSEKDLKEEMITSNMNLEKKLGIQINYFAYPNGNYNHKFLQILEKSDYRLGLTMDDNFISKNINKLKIPRIGINNSHSFAEFTTLFLPLNIIFRKLIKLF